MSQTTKTLTANHGKNHFSKLTCSSSKMKMVSETKSSKLQFFVRMWNSNTLVIRASSEKKVESLLEQISFKTKIPIEHQRLIYEGKQLQLEQSLRECGIENDADLQLVGRLRSIVCPKAWKAKHYIVSLILRLCTGKSVIGASTIIDDYFTNYINDSEYFSVSMFMEIPSLLVDLYANGRIAYSVIKDFVKICLNSKDKKLQGVYLEVLLEFCELLRRTGCKSDDRLYVFCRDSFASLLTLVGGVSFHNPKGKVMLRGVFDCVHEIAYKLLRFLDLSMNCPTGEGLSFKVVLDFVKFSDHLRMGLAMHQAPSDEFLNCAICYTEGPLFAGVVDQLHIVFIKLLSKMDKCLEVMEDCLVNKKHGKGDGAAVHNGWSHYIIILKVLFHISKFYSSAQEQFWGLFLRRKNVLPHMIVRYVKKTDDHRWLLENRIVTDFESRRHLVMMLFPDLNDEILGYEMLIDRSQVLAESFGYISQAMPRSLQGDLLMAFKNEKATGPGVLREWFVLVCQEIFNPRNALFVACPNDHRRFFPNTASMVNALHLRYFIFSGRIIALALKKKVHVGIVFDRVFFKQLAGNYIITLEDIRDADPIMYSSCKQILEMDADYIDSDALGLTFSIEVEELGHREVIKLCPGGESLVVDSKNREKYVHLLIQNRFVTSISKQVSHFAQGFADIISCSRLEFFQFLDHEDFDWMLHGSENDINVEDWKAHTKYLGYKKNDRQISWFWKIVRKMSAEQKKVLLFFWTSVKHLPVEGFHGLSSTLLISKSPEPGNHLPSSLTHVFPSCAFPRILLWLSCKIALESSLKNTSAVVSVLDDGE